MFHVYVFPVVIKFLTIYVLWNHYLENNDVIWEKPQATDILSEILEILEEY